MEWRACASSSRRGHTTSSTNEVNVDRQPAAAAAAEGNRGISPAEDQTSLPTTYAVVAARRAAGAAVGSGISSDGIIPGAGGALE